MYDQNAAQLLRELEALKAEVPKALYLTQLNEVMGRGVMADKVPLLAATLREHDQSEDRTQGATQ